METQRKTEQTYSFWDVHHTLMTVDKRLLETLWGYEEMGHPHRGIEQAEKLLGRRDLGERFWFKTDDRNLSRNDLKKIGEIFLREAESFARIGYLLSHFENLSDCVDWDDEKRDFLMRPENYPEDLEEHVPPQFNVMALRESSLLPAPTMREFCHEFMERHAKPHRSTWKEDLYRITRDIIPALGDKHLNEIRPFDIVRLHGRLSKKAPINANRTIELLRAMFNRAELWGYMVERNPALAVQRNRETQRTRWVTPEELPRLAKALENDSNVYAVAAIKLYLLTGCRKNEILKARWEDLDVPRKTLKLEAPKTGKPYFVILSTKAIEIIERIPRVEGNPYIIVGDVPGKHLVCLNRPWRRIKKAAGLNDLRLHDLRHTVGSWLAQDGHSLHLIGQALNHSKTDTTKRYAHFQRKDLEKAMEKHGEKIAQFLELG